MRDRNRAGRIFAGSYGSVRPMLLRPSLLLLSPLVLALAAAGSAQEQTQPAAPASQQQPVERPGDVYKELMQPLDQVRSSMDNWSPAELAALAAGIKRAQEYCAQVAPTQVAGDHLYQLARVCSVGQRWNDADAAASAYIKSASQPYQAHAYAIRVNALLNLKDTTMAVEVARSMLHSVAYDATVDHSIAYLIHYLAMSLDDAALPVAQERQPFLLAALSGEGLLKEVPGDAVVGAAEMYDEGLELAYLEAYAGKPSEAQQARAVLDTALAKVPPEKIDNQAEIERARRQYALLGEKLPRIDILRFAAPGTPQPRINPRYGSATVLFLFPEWCAQCRKMMQPLNDFLIRNNAREIHAYGVLALNADETGANPFQSDSFKDLLHTPTLTTPDATLTSLGAVNFPFAVITDGAGRIRFLGRVSENAFDAGGFIEQVIEKNSTANAHTGAPRTSQ